MHFLKPVLQDITKGLSAFFNILHPHWKTAQKTELKNTRLPLRISTFRKTPFLEPEGQVSHDILGPQVPIRRYYKKGYAGCQRIELPCVQIPIEYGDQEDLRLFSLPPIGS